MNCDSGRRADFGGRWQTPCQALFVRHTLFTEAPIRPLLFCDKHMQQLIDAGLIDHPNVNDEEIRRLRDHYRKGSP